MQITGNQADLFASAEGGDELVLRLREAISRIDRLRRKDARAAQDMAEEAAMIAETTLHPHLQAQCLRLVGACQVQRGEAEAALDTLQAARILFDRMDDNEGRLRCDCNLGEAHLSTGQISAAIETFRGALEQARDIGNDEESHRLLTNIGVCHERMGDYPSALEHYFSSLEGKQDSRDERGQAHTLHHIGNVYFSLGEYGQARDYNQRSLSILTALDDQAGLASLHNGMGRCLTQLDQTEEALEQFETALNISSEQDNPLDNAQALLGLSRLSQHAGDRDQAIEQAQAALVQFETIKAKDGQAETLLLLGDLALDEGQLEHAQKHYEKILEICQTFPARVALYRAFKGMARIAEARGDYEAAYRRFRRYHRLRNEVLGQDVDKRIKALTLPLELEQAKMETELYRLRNVDLVEKNEQLRESQQENRRLVAQLEEKASELELQTRQDHLTGISNRRHFDAVLQREWERARRFKRSLGLALLDIDDFKAINDTYSHQAGDAVLQGIAKLIRESTRQSDIAARYGGEEFVLLFPETDRDTTATICDKILQSIENQVWRLGNDEVRITVSIGAADNAECRNAEELLERADERLYKAKDAGKNQVVIQ